MKIYQIFIKNFINTKKKIIFFEKKGYTFKDITKYISLTEKYISNQKIVIIISNNSLFHVVLYLICSKLNKTFIPLDPETPPHDLLSIIRKYNSKNIFSSDTVSKILNKKKIFNFNLSKLQFKKNVKKINIIKKNNNNNFKNIFLLSFTSGSTGYPKPIALSEDIKILRAESNLTLYKIKKNSNFLISTPLYHTLAIRLLNMFILKGLNLNIMTKYNSKNFLRYILQKKINFTFFVSNQLTDLLKNNNNIEVLNNLSCVVTSSSTLSNQKKHILIKKLKKKFYECYGLSEGAILTNNLINKKTINSVGKPIKGVQLKIIKKEKNKIGEIFFKSNQMFLGYLTKNMKLNKKLINGYFGTGDMGYIKKKNLYLTGRKKNMIKILGKSVFIEDIEKSIKEEKIVNNFAITSVRNKEMEEQICLIYDNDKYLNDHNIKLRCIKSLPRHFLPRYFIPTSLIPKNNLGKINKLKLNQIVSDYLKIK